MKTVRKYVAGVVIKELSTNIGLNINLKSTESGCSGMMPVFEKEEDAQTYAGENGLVVAVDIDTTDSGKGDE